MIVESLTAKGAQVQAYDPIALADAARVFGDLPGLRLVDSAEKAFCGADAMLIVTEWKAFRTPDLDPMREALKNRGVFDGRNLYEPATMHRAGIEHHAKGRPMRRGAQAPIGSAQTCARTLASFGSRAPCTANAPLRPGTSPFSKRHFGSVAVSIRAGSSPRLAKR